MCSDCNLRRSNRYELEHLVQSVSEHLQPPLTLDFLEIIIEAFLFAHECLNKNNSFPSPQDLANEFYGGEKATMFEQDLAQTFVDFRDFFAGKKPDEMTKKQQQALKFRWGYIDGNLYSLLDTCDEYEVKMQEMVILERSLLSRVGWYISDTKSDRKRWEKT